MKKNLFLLGALAVGLAASAQTATTKRLIDTQTYDYKAVYNDVTNNQKIGEKNKKGNRFVVNLGSGKEDRKDGNTTTYKNYKGTNMPANGQVYIGDENKVVEGGLSVPNAGRGFVIDSLEVGDVITIDYTTNTEGELLTYAMGTSLVDSIEFTKDVDGTPTKLVSGETTIASGEAITLASKGSLTTRAPYFAGLTLKGAISKVVITRGENTITYDYAAEASSVLSLQSFATKNKLGSNSKFWANLGEGKEHRCDGNTTGYKEYTGTILPKAIGDIYIGDENKVDANGMKIQNKNRQFAVDSLNVGDSFIVEYTANDGSDMVYAMSQNLADSIIFVNAAGDTLKSQSSTIKSGEEITLVHTCNLDSLKKVYGTRAPYFTAIGLPGYISKVTILKREEVTPLTVTVAEGIENGEVKTASKYEIVAAGDEITVTTTPSEGYVLATLTVTDAEGKEVEVAEGKFTMPASNVTIAATFAKEGTGEKEVYIAYATTESGVTHNADFAAVVDDKNVATNVADGMSKVTTTGTASIELVAVGGTTPAANKEEGGDYIDKDGNVSQWNEIKWELKNQGDINFNYLIGTGNPYVGLAAEEIVTDGQPTGTYRAQYTYYEEDGSKGLPLTGLYYEFKANASGALRVGIWANKGGRITYVVDKETAKAMNYLVEGYVNGQNNEDGTKKYLTNDEIVALHNEAGKDNKYIIGAGGQPFWGYVSFNVEAGKSYLLFQHSSQVGFSGYEFTKDSVIDIPETFNVKIDVSKLSEKDAKKVSVSSTVVKVDDKVTLTANIQNTDSVVVATATIGGEEVEVTKNEDGTFTVTATDKGDIVFTVALAKEETTPTPVNNIIADELNGDNTIYDLSGRKVVNPTRGIYIKNGKKFVVK
ncbi:MAG: hypothetical protein IKR17_12655 [Bacteroidales bacterium]|nr:hypothetical protein [Bacteroidales bacterium]